MMGHLADGPQLPALVLGAGTPIGLAIARGLRHNKVPLVGVSLDPTAPTCRSKLWQSTIPVREPTEQAWLEALDTAHERFGRMVLLPAEDTIVVPMLAEHAGELEKRFDFVLPNPPVITRLHDKAAFHDWASANKFPVPRTVAVTNQSELHAALRHIGFPLVLKPFARTPHWCAVSPRDKIYRLDSYTDVQRLSFDPFDAADHYVVQEWIPGRDSDVYFCLTYRDRNGADLASQTGRKLAQWPVGTGNTALAVTHASSELHKLTHELLDAVGHVGFGSLEIRLSSADGRMLITEPTVGRPNLQTTLAAAAGVNLVQAAYRDALRMTPTSPAPTREAIWIHEATITRSLMVASSRRCVDVRVLLTALRARRTPTGAVFSIGDYLPIVLVVARQAAKALRPVLAPLISNCRLWPVIGTRMPRSRRRQTQVKSCSRLPSAPARVRGRRGRTRSNRNLRKAVRRPRGCTPPDE